MAQPRHQTGKSRIFSCQDYKDRYTVVFCLLQFTSEFDQSFIKIQTESQNSSLLILLAGIPKYLKHICL